jgi:hypothetical protein
MASDIFSNRQYLLEGREENASSPLSNPETRGCSLEVINSYSHHI